MSEIRIAHCGGVLTCDGYVIGGGNISDEENWSYRNGNPIVKWNNKSGHKEDNYQGQINYDGCNPTDADAFIIIDSNLEIFKSNCYPKMVCKYNANSNGIKIINDSSNIWAKDIIFDNNVGSGTVLCDYDSFASNTSYGIGSYENNAVYQQFITSACTIEYSFINVTRSDIGNEEDMPLETNVNMFSNCVDLVSCEIPCRMRVISSGSFSGCTSLTSYTKNYEFVESIGNSAFEGCTSLPELIIPPYATFGDNCFKGCSNATAITWYGIDSEYITDICSRPEIPSSMCSGCTSLIATNFDSAVFNDTIVFPRSINIIKTDAFNGCTSIQKLDINNVTEIEQSAFANCTSLNYIDFGAVDKIGNKAFSGCASLTSINIPSTIDSIGDYAFSGCSISSCIINAQIPPTVGANSFPGSYNIKVPDVAVYQTQAAINKGWGAYTSRLMQQ